MVTAILTYSIISIMHKTFVSCAVAAYAFLNQIKRDKNPVNMWCGCVFILTNYIEIKQNRIYDRNIYKHIYMCLYV